jgi:methylene-tetrahydromethanopterin dehydrogenase
LPEPQFRKVFIFLDTDKHASPFDILTTIDAFPEATIMKYENVTAEDADRILYDAMFPRGPEGAKQTKVFINGRDFDLANEILTRAKKCMFPPFELSVIIDPRGAYTTASAAVAKTLNASLEKNLGTLKNKHVTVLAGTGPVGQTAARLYAYEKAEVVVTSRMHEKASSVAAKINEELKSEKVRGFQAQNSEDIGNAIADAEIILSAGAAGTELLPQAVLREEGKNCKIVADINAIPPLGVAGLDSNTDAKEMMPGVIGIGALAIGKLKNKIEVALIKKAAEEPKGIFDYKMAYELAKKFVTEKREDKKAPKADQQKSWLP